MKIGILGLDTSHSPAFNGSLHFDERTVSFARIEAPHYTPFVGKLVEFFAAGTAPVVKEETLAVCSILSEMAEVLPAH